jgi:hypothetical protein
VVAYTLQFLQHRQWCLGPTSCQHAAAPAVASAPQVVRQQCLWLRGHKQQQQQCRLRQVLPLLMVLCSSCS